MSELLKEAMARTDYFCLSDANEDLRLVKAELREIMDAINRSGMGIMRTSKGPSDTMIGYSAENQMKYRGKMIELINENVSLDAENKQIKKVADEMADALEYMQDNDLLTVRPGGQSMTFTNQCAAKDIARAALRRYRKKYPKNETNA